MTFRVNAVTKITCDLSDLVESKFSLLTQGWPLQHPEGKKTVPNEILILKNSLIKVYR